MVSSVANDQVQHKQNGLRLFDRQPKENPPSLAFPLYDIATKKKNPVEACGAVHESFWFGLQNSRNICVYGNWDLFNAWLLRKYIIIIQDP